MPKVGDKIRKLTTTKSPVVTQKNIDPVPAKVDPAPPAVHVDIHDPAPAHTIELTTPTPVSWPSHKYDETKVDESPAVPLTIQINTVASDATAPHTPTPDPTAAPRLSTGTRPAAGSTGANTLPAPAGHTRSNSVGGGRSNSAATVPAAAATGPTGVGSQTLTLPITRVASGSVGGSPAAGAGASTSAGGNATLTLPLTRVTSGSHSRTPSATIKPEDVAVAIVVDSAAAHPAAAAAAPAPAAATPAAADDHASGQH